MEAAEAVGQDAAGEVSAQLALDVGREAGTGRAGPGASQEGLEVLEQGGVEHARGNVSRIIACLRSRVLSVNSAMTRFCVLRSERGCSSMGFFWCVFAVHSILKATQ